MGSSLHAFLTILVIRILKAQHNKGSKLKRKGTGIMTPELTVDRKAEKHYLQLSTNEDSKPVVFKLLLAEER